MQLALLVIAGLQSGASPAPALPAVDLTNPNACSEQQRLASDEIVVCGRKRENPYRLRETFGPTQSRLPSAKVELTKGVSLAAETEKGEVGGVPTNRAMVRVKIKFYAVGSSWLAAQPSSSQTGCGVRDTVLAR
jgi:hypothetical protein